MKRVFVDEKAWFFEKREDKLVLTNCLVRRWCNVDLDKEKLLLGECNIPLYMLNKLTVTYQDQFRLQCVSFCNPALVNFDHLKEELKNITGFQYIMTDNILYHGRIANGAEMSLRESVDYADKFKQFDEIRNFVQGNKVSTFMFKHEAPKRIPTDVETVIITDSYMEDLNFLAYSDNLKSVVIERSIIKNFDILAHLHDLTGLYIEAVELPNSSIVKNMNKLKRIGLVDCGLKEIYGLIGKTDLIFCDISYNDLQEIDYVWPLFWATNLMWLSISDCMIESLNVKFWPELRVLEIDGNSLEYLHNLQFCKNLKFIDYSANAIKIFYGRNRKNWPNFYFHPGLDWAIALEEKSKRKKKASITASSNISFNKGRNSKPKLSNMDVDRI